MHDLLNIKFLLHDLNIKLIKVRESDQNTKAISMTEGCAIPGCPSQYGKTTLFGICNNPEMAEWWKTTPWSSRRGNKLTPQRTQICVLHFHEDQLDRSHRVPRLMPNAVPSVNIPSTSQPQDMDKPDLANESEMYTNNDPLTDNCSLLLIYCRFCGKKQKTPIQNHLEDLVQSEELLQLCLGRGRFLEGFPNGVCDHCLKAINVTTQFIQNCEKAQEKLQKMFFGTTQQMADSFEAEEEQQDELDNSFLIPEAEVLFHEPEESNVKVEELDIDDGDPLDEYEEDEKEFENAEQGTAAQDPEGAIQCDVCKRTFNRKRALKAHMESIHEKRTFSCKICGKTMGWRKTLQRHMKSHEENYYKHKCDLCDKTFSRPSHLRLHMIKHTGEKIRCPLCTSGYRCNYKLSEHLVKAHQLELDVAKLWVQMATKG